MAEDVVFNDAEKEMLALAKYHIKRMQGRIDAGKKEDDDDKRIEILKNVPALVMNRAKSRKEHEQSLAREKAGLLKYRQSADCPTCGKPRNVTIEGSAKNERFGWGLDVVKCTTCKTKFTNPMPNNWNDMLAYMENLHSKLFSGTEEANEVLQRMDAQELVDKEQAIQDLKAFKEAHLIAEAARVNSEAAWVAADAAFEAYYDALLLAKVNQENLNPGGKYFA